MSAVAVVLAFVGAPVAQAQSRALSGRPTLTDPAQVWAVPTELKRVAHPLLLEGRIAYVDRVWRHLWLERDGLTTYLMLSPNGPDLRDGQLVRIQGTIVPAIGLDRAAVTVTVLQPNVEPQVVDAAGSIASFATLHGRIVRTDGFVDAEQIIDDEHVVLSLIVNDQPVTAYVRRPDKRAAPGWTGRFVRLTGLYQRRFDPTHTQAAIELWIGDAKDVQVLGSIDDAPLFARSAVAIADVPQQPLGTTLKVRGCALQSIPGQSVVVRDDSGQILVETLQAARIPGGAEVEAVGRAVLVRTGWRLEDAFVRIVRNSGQEQTAASGASMLTHVDQIRALTLEEAAQAHPVSITGVVTWSLAGEDFFFLEDVSGGIRVRFSPERLSTPPRNKYLQIDGVTCSGGFAPAVELRAYKDLGALSTPPVKRITFKQGITGQEDGQLVEMHGFYRSTDVHGDTQRINVTTPSGEFVALLRTPLPFQARPGSLIRLFGPCEVTADQNGRISGLIVRVPALSAIVIEENAPEHSADVPKRSIKHLRQLNTARELTRVRVEGVVLHAGQNGLVFLQDTDAGLVVLTRNSAGVKPGDRVEAVGILGWEGVRTVLREAALRRIGDGELPAPVDLLDSSRVSLGLDARLVRARGTLTDVVTEADRLRLTLQTGNARFDALFDRAGGDIPNDLNLGAGLEVTGVYRVGFDDAGRARSFQIQLRSPADVVEFRRARLITLPRALTAAGILAGCSLIALVWVTALRRRVRRQTEQIRTQLERQAKLEAEVQHAMRLESLGVLAGGIAHDFNNLLTIIIGNLGLAMVDERAMASVGNCLRDCERGAARARELTQQLMSFAKGGEPQRAIVSLSDIVRDTADFVLRGGGCRCEYDVPSGLWKAEVDRTQIGQVVQNLVLNAKQAMTAPGVIRISLRNETIAKKVNPVLTGGRYLRLAISDSGQGIAPENLARIFEPYFTTKQTGRGLGLATVYSIVKKHHGHIQVSSSLGMGTTFTLWLPAAVPDAAAISPAPVSAVPQLASTGPV